MLRTWKFARPQSRYLCVYLLNHIRKQIANQVYISLVVEGRTMPGNDCRCVKFPQLLQSASPF